MIDNGTEQKRYTTLAVRMRGTGRTAAGQKLRNGETDRNRQKEKESSGRELVRKMKTENMKWLRAAAEEFLELLYPRRCPICQKILDRKEKLVCEELRQEAALYPGAAV